MREIRDEMRSAASPELSSVPAFRVLIFARYFPGGSVSELAAHHGVSLPTASVSVDRLVEQGFLESRGVPGDRRRRALHLTSTGRRLVDGAMSHTTDVFATRLGALQGDDLARVHDAIDTLATLLGPETASASSSASDPLPEEES
jgi:MarR family transcriptional regulator for hemolysin